MTTAERELTDAEIVAIRDDHLPSQGEGFDCIAFARAILQARGYAAPPRTPTPEMLAAVEGREISTVIPASQTEQPASAQEKPTTRNVKLTDAECDSIVRSIAPARNLASNRERALIRAGWRVRTTQDAA